jgi:chemotaxis protein CheD
MNHMLSTVSVDDSGVSNLAGINAMELIINDIVKLGGQRTRLRAKAFGGARMISGTREIGRVNSEFVLAYLHNEGIRCDSHSLGGASARHLLFWPGTGRVMLKTISDVPVEKPAQIEAPTQAGNGLELF